jgi:hypothetical protein
MLTLRTVSKVTGESGFRSDSVEKVLRLCGILERLDRHPTRARSRPCRGLRA